MNRLRISLLVLLSLSSPLLHSAGGQLSLVNTFTKEGSDFWDRDDDQIAHLIYNSASELCDFDVIVPIFTKAIIDGRTQVVEAFANSCECDGIVYFPINEQGKTPLMLAAGEGRIGIVKFLCTKNVKVDTQDYTGWTALTYAQQSQEKSSDACYQYLLNKFTS